MALDAFGRLRISENFIAFNYYNLHIKSAR